MNLASSELITSHFNFFLEHTHTHEVIIIIVIITINTQNKERDLKQYKESRFNEEGITTRGL